MAQSQRSREAIQKKQLTLRDRLWPNLDTDRLWDRKRKVGFTTIPRVMPILLRIMDSVTNGKPVSAAYLDLWCRAHDECFVTLANPTQMAFHAGFTGQRAVTTWKARIRSLAALGFIDVQPGPSGDLSYALLWNPYLVLKRLYREKTPGFTKDLYHALQERTIEIGAHDLDEPDGESESTSTS
jgi:hypothetical protein